MPSPDPKGVTRSNAPSGMVSVLVDTYLAGNRKARMARAMQILSYLEAGGWQCRWCGDQVPFYRRADARFCCEGCRKRAARLRRRERVRLKGATQGSQSWISI